MDKRFIVIVVFLLLLVGSLGFLFSNLGNTDIVSNSVGLSDNGSLNQSNSTDNVNKENKNQKDLAISINKSNSKKILNNENIKIKKDSKSKISPVNSNKKVNETDVDFKNNSTNDELKLLTKREAYDVIMNMSTEDEDLYVPYKKGKSYDEGENKHWIFPVYDKKTKKAWEIAVSAVDGKTWAYSW